MCETKTLASGFCRHDSTGKARYDLIPADILERIAIHYAKGAEKFGENNWKLSNSQEDFTSGHASAFRHFMQYFAGDADEDHLAACVWNMILCDYVRNGIR